MPSTYARQIIAVEWKQRGLEFLAAAMLLYQRQGHTFVVAHLIAQSCELLAKSYLIWADPELTEPELRVLGHDLVKLCDRLSRCLGKSCLNAGSSRQLTELNELFKTHQLRYAGYLQHILAPATIPDCGLLLKRIYKLIKLANRNHVWQLPP